MEFWKKFYNQPMLWGLALFMAVAIGIFIDVAPTQFILVNNTPLSDHQWTSDGFFYDVATQYAVFTGYVQEELGISVSVRYSRSLRWIITIALLSLVVVFTKRSDSALFIAGPLVVFLVAAGIIINGLHPEDNIDFAKMIFSGVTWYIVIGFGIMIVFKYLAKIKAIGGIDEEGPLDFSRLQNVAVTTAGALGQTANTMGNRISQSLGDVSSSGAPSAQPGSQPLVSRFKINDCIYCGCPVRGGKCTICKRPGTNTDYIIDIVYGVCEDCRAPRALHARYCYSCGLLFETDGVSSNVDPISAQSSIYCGECGTRWPHDHQFCGKCGHNLAEQRSVSSN